LKLASIIITLHERKLAVSYPDEAFRGYFSLQYAAFSLDEIAEARILAADDPKIQQYLFGGVPEFTPKHTKVYLRDRYILPVGHQVMDLKLRNGRHVLIETDDADNFLAALKRCGVGDDGDYLDDKR
jgi:hypothetical protein